jgi:hypothetical protein
VTSPDEREYDEHDLQSDELLAALPVSFAKRRTVDAGAFRAPSTTNMSSAAAMRLGRRPTFSGIGAYRRWCADAESCGFPVAGMAMLLGLTARDLVVFTPHFFRARSPKRRAGAIPLSDIVQMTAMRSVLTGRVVILMHDGGIVELETMRVGRARRFVAATMAQKAQLH